MPYFEFKGRNSEGALQQGAMESASAAALADTLAQSGITPIRIDAARAPGENALAQLARLRDHGRVGHIDILLFSRQMHTLLKAGVPIMRALAGLQ